MKSDNSMFVEKVERELEKLDQFSIQHKNSNYLIGKTLAQITESILSLLCISIDENAYKGE